jgi:hypothetical protein
VDVIFREELFGLVLAGGVFFFFLVFTDKVGILIKAFAKEQK